MKIRKTAAVFCVIAMIISALALSVSADMMVGNITSSTTVIWNARETQARAQTIATEPNAVPFMATAVIYSTSTGEGDLDVKFNTNGETTIIPITKWVNVTYPSPIPLVHYSGNCGYT